MQNFAGNGKEIEVIVMCNKRNSTITLIKDAGKQKAIVRKVDDCLSMLIGILNRNGIETLACCCGHGEYPMSIVAKIHGFPVELFSGRRIPRKRKFYRKNPEGYYYIPEAVDVFMDKL